MYVHVGMCLFFRVFFLKIIDFSENNSTYRFFLPCPRAYLLLAYVFPVVLVGIEGYGARFVRAKVGRVDL